MKKEKKEFNVSSKNIKMRIILFVVATLVAVAGFSYGIYSLSKNSKGKQGWNTYSLEADAKYPFYYQNVYLKYYYDKDEVSSKSAKVKSLFHLASKNVYSLIDSTKENESLYKDVKGLSYINNHPNEKIKIEKQLYDILVDAKAKTYKEESNYSIFSGFLYDYWEYFMNSSSSVISENYINELVDLINGAGNFSLLLEEEGSDFYCTYSYSNEVENVIEEYDLKDASALDLNVLFYSYYLNGVYEKLNSGGLTKGVLYTHTGEIINMHSGFTSGNEINLFDYDGYNIINYGNYKCKGKSVVSNIRVFPIYEQYEAEFCFKYIDKSSKWSTRNMYYSSKTGYSLDTIKSSTLFDESENSFLPDVTYMNLNYVSNGDINNVNGINDDISIFAISSLEDSVVYKYNVNSRINYLDDAYIEKYKEKIITNV